MGYTALKKMKRCILCDNSGSSEVKLFRYPTKDICLCENCIRKLYNGVEEYSKKNIKPKCNNFSKVPKEIKKELDKKIIGQDEAKISMSIAVYNHYKRTKMYSDVKIDKSNILLIGPTGSGKTLIAKTIADMLDVPFTIVDCTSLTETGYVGDDIDSIISKLIMAAGGDISKAENGIVFLDEIDKLAKRSFDSNTSKDPSGEGVQQCLLKLIEGARVSVNASGSKKNLSDKTIEFNTENVLFICGGAFSGLENIINNRTKKKPEKRIGFGSCVEKEEEKSITDAFKLVTTEDIVRYGFMPEFIGRLSVIVTLNALTENDLIDIMTKPKDSIINQYKEYFKYDGVKLEFTSEALKNIAKQAIEQNTGARGLRGIIEVILKEAMYNIPSNSNIKTCIVDNIEKEYSVKYYDETDDAELNFAY